MFAIVKDEQEPSCFELRRERRQRIISLPKTNAQSCCNRPGDKCAVTDRRQIDEPNLPLFGALKPSRDFHRDTRLADAARARYRDQPVHF
jgi:hypothetical protein